jgi:hypothetical protein
MDSSTQFICVGVSISLTAALLLLGIWLRGYIPLSDYRRFGPPGSGPQTKESRQARKSRDDGIRWLSIACALWCVTGVLQLSRLLGHPEIFLRTLFSGVNSVCFLLAATNLDEVNRDPESLLRRILTPLGKNPILLFALVITAYVVLALGDLNRPGPERYYTLLDVLIGVVTVCLIAWGFFVSFWKREFPLLACASIPAFAVLALAQLIALQDVRLITSLANATALQRILKVTPALGSASAGMASLLFLALALSWVYDMLEEIIDLRDQKFKPDEILRDIPKKT